MATTVLQDKDLLPASAIVAASADYKSVDPGAVLVQCHRGTALIVDIDVTLASGGGGVTVTIKGFDEASGTYNTILASALIVAPAHSKLTISPMIATAANVSAQSHLPPKVQITCVGSGTRTTLTYSVGVILAN